MVAAIVAVAGVGGALIALRGHGGVGNRGALVIRWSARQAAKVASQIASNRRSEVDWVYVYDSPTHHLFAGPLAPRGKTLVVPPGRYLVDLEFPPGFIGLATPLCEVEIDIRASQTITATLSPGAGACALVQGPGSRLRHVTYPQIGGPGATQVPIGERVLYAKFWNGHLWAVEDGRQCGFCLIEIDPQTHQVLATHYRFSMPHAWSSTFTIGGGRAWVSYTLCRHTGCDRNPSTLLELSLTSGRQTRVTTFPVRVDGLGFGDGHLWITLPDRLLKLDPSTGQVVGSCLAVHGGGAVGVAYGSVWVFGDSLFRVDPHDMRETGKLHTGAMSAPAGQGDWIGGGYVWLLGTPQAAPDGLLRVDPRSQPLSGQGFLQGWGGGAVVSSDGSVWLSGSTSTDTRTWMDLRAAGDGWIHVDPSTGKVLGPIIGGSGVGVIATGGGYLWVSVSDQGNALLQIPLG